MLPIFYSSSCKDRTTVKDSIWLSFNTFSSPFSIHGAVHTLPPSNFLIFFLPAPQQGEGVTAIIKNVKNRNFPNAWESGKFPKCLGICEISQVPRHLRKFQNLKNIPPSNTCRNLGNFSNAWVSGKFP